MGTRTGGLRCGLGILAASWPLATAGCTSDRAPSQFDGGAISDAASTPDGFWDASFDAPSIGCASHDDCQPEQTCKVSGSCVPTGEVCPGGCTGTQFCSAEGGCIAARTCKANQDCTTGLVCDPTGLTCVPGGGCGTSEFIIEVVQPNVMLVLDRSGSMGDADVPGTGLTRWQVATQAIEQVTTSYGGQIRFGLVLFSACAPGGCSPGAIVQGIPTDPGVINQTVADAILCPGNDPETSIGETLASLVGEPTLQDPVRDNSVLLLTDGDDNCGGGGPQAAQALRGQTVPVRTFVVGFTGDVDANELTAIAEAAGTAPYHQADDPASLQAALADVATTVVSCTFKLASEPPAEAMYVFFNNALPGIPNSVTNGYTYDPATNTVTFHGAACESLKSGSVTDVSVVFGCPFPTPK